MSDAFKTIKAYKFIGKKLRKDNHFPKLMCYINMKIPKNIRNIKVLKKWLNLEFFSL
jgi:hypothetical protein